MSATPSSTTDSAGSPRRRRENGCHNSTAAAERDHPRQGACLADDAGSTPRRRRAIIARREDCQIARISLRLSEAGPKFATLQLAPGLQLPRRRRGRYIEVNGRSAQAAAARGAAALALARAKGPSSRADRRPPLPGAPLDARMIAKVQLLAALFGSASAASSGKPHLIFMLAESVAIPRPPG